LYKSSKPCRLNSDIEVFDYEIHVGKGNFHLELLRKSLERNLDSLVKPGNDVFFCAFSMNRQLTYIIATQSPSRTMTNCSELLSLCIDYTD